MCINAPSFEDIFKKIKPWLDNQIIISHRIGYIKNVLHSLLEWHKLKVNIIDYLSSQEVARVDLPRLNDSSISNVYKHFFKSDFNKHDAIEVAKANAKIVIRIVEDWDPPSFERMVSALYGVPASFRINGFGKVRFRSLYTDPNYKFLEKTELQGTGFTFLGGMNGMSKNDASKFVLSYGGKVNDKVNTTTTHVIVKSEDISLKLQGSNKDELPKALQMSRNGKEISILSEAKFLQLVNIVKDQEEKSKLLSTPLAKS
ncbi:MAG: BRCT domain-containing protein [Saprospiraceae bacterium]